MKLLSTITCLLCVAFSFGAERTLPEGAEQLKAIIQSHKQQIVELRETQKAEVDAFVADKPKLKALVEKRREMRQKKGERVGQRKEQRRERKQNR